MTDTAIKIPALTLRRTFKAARERVFDAWTDPERLRNWFGPPGSRLSDVTFDARVGGSYRIAMISRKSGETFVARGIITEYQRPERLAFTLTWEEDDPKDEHETLVEIAFRAHGDGTEMIFTQDNFRSEESRSDHTEGWNGSFDRLSAAEDGTVLLRGMDLSGYMCKDAKRAIAFYHDVFGLEPSMVYPDDRGAEFDLADGTTFGLWGGGGKVMPFQPGNGIMFAVDDVAAAVRNFEARGIPIVYRTETPICYIAMINDTEGNIVTVHQRKA